MERKHAAIGNETATSSDRSPAELWILVDGLGWRFAEHHSFLSWLHDRHPLRTVLGFSSTAVPSLLTGLSPSEHGGWTLYYRNPAGSPFAWLRPLSWIPLERLPRGRYRTLRWVARETLRRSAIKGYFALYEVPFRCLPEFDIAWKGGIFDPGHDGPPTFLDSWREKEPDVYVGTYPLSDGAIRSGAEAAIARGVHKVFCYFGDIDGTLHKYAHDPDAPAIADALSSLDAWILDQANRMSDANGSVRVICFSDHGMTPVASTLDLTKPLESLRLGRDGTWFLDSTMARFWPSPGVSRPRLRARFDGLPGRFLTPEDLARERLPNDPARFGELIWLANPGVCIAPSWMGPKAPAGMHGFSPDDSWSDGLVASSDVATKDCLDVIALGRVLLSISRE
jgi:hypothetical protein